MRKILTFLLVLAVLVNLPLTASNFHLVNSSLCAVSGTPLVQFRIWGQQNWQNSASLTGCSGMGIGTCSTSFGGPSAFDGVDVRIVYYMAGAGSGCSAQYTPAVTGGSDMTFSLNGSDCANCYSNAPTCYTNSYSVYNGDPVSHSFGFYNNGVLTAYFIVGAGKTAGTSISWCSPGGTVPSVKTVCFDCDGTSAPGTIPNLLSDVSDPSFTVNSNSTASVTTSVPGVDGSSLTNITFGGSSSALTEGTFKSGIQGLYTQAGAIGAKLDADLMAANSHLLDVDQGIDLSNVKLDGIDSSIDSVGSSVVSAVNSASSTQHTDAVAEKTSTDAVKSAVDQVKSVADEQKQLLVTIANNTAAPEAPSVGIPAELTNSTAAMAFATEHLGGVGGKFDSLSSGLAAPTVSGVPHPSMTIDFIGGPLDLDPAVRFPGLSEFLHAMFKIVLSIWFIYAILKLLWETVQAYGATSSPDIPVIGSGVVGYGLNLFGLAISLTAVAAAIGTWAIVFDWLLNYILNSLGIWTYLETVMSANPIAVYLIFYIFPVQFAINLLCDYWVAKVSIGKLFLYATTCAKVLARA